MVAATRGPVPERTDQTVRHSEPVDKVEVFGEVEVPELNLDNPHPLVVDLYESMKESAQARYYEPSDWQYARLTFHELNKMLYAEKTSAMLLTAINQMLTALILTEGDRRRVRIEVERKQGKPEGVVIDAAKQFKQWLEAP